MRLGVRRYFASPLSERRTGDATARRRAAIFRPARAASKVPQLPALRSCPIHDDNGNIIPTDDTTRLRARIVELERHLGIGEPHPAKQITYDPGPLPSRTVGEILYAVSRAIKRNVPKADKRPAEEVISEVTKEF
jgi:hypothetical protein